MSKSKVIAYALRIRKGAGKNHPTIGFLRRNEIVDVLAMSSDKLWAQIKTASGLTGWSSAIYLQPVSAEPQPPPPVTPATAVYRVTAHALFVRTGAGTNFPISGYLVRDETVDGIKKNTAGTWIKIRRANGTVGWCSATYLKLVSITPPPPQPQPEPEPNPDPAPVPEPSPIPKNPHYRVTAYALNLRNGPGEQHSVITYMLRDEIVEYLDFSAQGGWMKVRRINGQTGWSAARYLAAISGPPSPPAPEVDDLEKTGLHRVTSEILALRVTPESTAQIKRNLEYEQIVDVLAISPDKKWKQIATARGEMGWCDAHYLDHLGKFGELQPDEEFPWMTAAFGELGMREFPGSPDNPRIIEYLMSTSLAVDYPHYMPDEIDWCAAFVNWCVEQTSITSANSAVVYLWARWGKALATPRRGCIVTFQWEGGGQHTAFFLGQRGDRVYALGGNQSDAVWVKSYQTKYVTHYRIPSHWQTSP